VPPDIRQSPREKDGGFPFRQRVKKVSDHRNLTSETEAIISASSARSCFRDATPLSTYARSVWKIDKVGPMAIRTNSGLFRYFAKCKAD
jgi:hypothetical protein